MCYRSTLVSEIFLFSVPWKVSERMVSRALFLLNLPSQAERASRRENSKRRWGLLGKVGGIGRTSSQSYMAEGETLSALCAICEG